MRRNPEGMRRTLEFVAMTKDEGNAVDGPFSATCKSKLSFLRLLTRAGFGGSGKSRRRRGRLKAFQFRLGYRRSRLLRRDGPLDPLLEQLYFVAPTVMAMAMVSRNSSSVAPNSLATARQYCVQGSQPAPKEAPRAIKCFILRLMAPSA